MITGFNTDVKHRGLVYHVQTEDKGKDNPLIETLIYKGGEILGSRRLPYAGLVKGPDDEPTISRLMEEQHKGVMQDVKRGKYAPQGGATLSQDLSLDEIVLAYLAARFAENNVLTGQETKSLMTNEGATAVNYHTLPTALAGYSFEFVCQDADGIRVTASGGDTIQVIDKVTAAAGYIQSTTIGSVVRLVSVNATEWFATSIHGVWTDGTFTYDDTSLTTP